MLYLLPVRAQIFSRGGELVIFCEIGSQETETVIINALI